MRLLLSAAIASLALATAACGDRPSTPRPATATQSPEAVSRIGDVTIRANAVPTASLDAQVARQYGIARDDRTIMLLVGVRRGPEAQETALPAQITATATNLSGQRQDIVLRELRSGELLDYVGTVNVNLPDTVRFDLTIVRPGGASSTMQFSREFYPR